VRKSYTDPYPAPTTTSKQGKKHKRQSKSMTKHTLNFEKPKKVLWKVGMTSLDLRNEV
jgi:hypothetical protein